MLPPTAAAPLPGEWATGAATDTAEGVCTSSPACHGSGLPPGAVAGGPAACRLGLLLPPWGGRGLGPGLGLGLGLLLRSVGRGLGLGRLLA